MPNNALTAGVVLPVLPGGLSMPDIHVDPPIPATAAVTRTVTETTTGAANNGNGGLIGRFAQFGNLSAMGVVLIMFAFIVNYVVTNSATATKDLLQYSREETAYQRSKHDQDMILLTAGMTKNTENTAALINELKIGREALDKESKARQDAFDKRTEQQFAQIKELHDILIKKMNP